ncbi:hypothetical protein [Bacillus cereus]|uniref:Uncharacterized protein n=1 Tax=Bacillus cereus VD184 TaxID=1053242 RepID=A0A9W5R5R5_BACCE|nr:hypothetical protein [Bacillus cereus]EOQ10661.1 hypothetical protein IKC_05717 [Bacillus cereus VD184]
MAELNRLIAKGTIPCPNLILYGRGIQLIYSISGGAAPIMGYKAQYITNHFIKALMHVDVDGACSDLSRGFWCKKSKRFVVELNFMLLNQRDH